MIYVCKIRVVRIFFSIKVYDALTSQTSAICAFGEKNRAVQESKVDN